MTSNDLPRLQARDAVQGMIPWTFVHLLAVYLRERDAPVPSILGIPLESAKIGNLKRLPAEDFCEMLWRAAKHLNDPQLGLHLGQSARIAQLGALGYVLQSCENLGEVLVRLERYHRLVHDLNPIEYHFGVNHIEVRWGIAHGRPGALFDEAGICTIIQLSRELCGRPLSPARVDFVNPQPRHVAPYEDFLGCPVQFDCAVTRLLIPMDLLSMPLARPDAMLLKLMEDQVELALSDLPDTGDLADMTRRVVANLAKDGMPELEQVAHEMRLTPRILYRRLAEQGLSFRDLRESALKQMAEQHLLDARLSLADVALLLGYSEQSAFTRAFKRWSGTTPTRWKATRMATD